jgi:hypothetical protein
VAGDASFLAGSGKAAILSSFRIAERWLDPQKSVGDLQRVMKQRAAICAAWRQYALRPKAMFTAK